MKKHHQVIFLPSGRRGLAEEGQPLLDLARQLGVEIESICAGHLTCGKCKVHIEEGDFQKHGIHSSRSHLSPADEAERLLLEQLRSPNARLACAAAVQGDLLVTVPEESQARKQIIRKSATERAIEVAPAVRQVYVEVEPAKLGDHRGDWGRLQAALTQQWNLVDLRIDLPALQGLQKALRQGKWAVTVTLWQDREVIDARPGYEEGVYGMALDIGSTTVAAYLCNLRNGRSLSADAMMNPQIPYGEDLMSRISYAMTHPDGLKKMHAAIIDTLNRLATRVAVKAGIRARQINEAVISPFVH